MSIKRWDARADTTSVEVREGLRAAGWVVYELRQPFDFLCGKDGRTELVEAKSEGGTLTAAQTRFLCTWTGRRPIFGRSSREVLAQLEPRPSAVAARTEAGQRAGAVGGTASEAMASVANGNSPPRDDRPPGGTERRGRLTRRSAGH